MEAPTDTNLWLSTLPFLIYETQASDEITVQAGLLKRRKEYRMIVFFVFMFFCGVGVMFKVTPQPRNE
jgi:hypothetical protein